MMYALHLSDLAALPALHPLRFLLRPFMTEQIVQIGTKFDAIGLVLDDSDSERFAAVHQVATSQPLPGMHYPIRFYQSVNGKGWRPIDPSAPA